jgi:lipopolysaccharide exporter
LHRGGCELKADFNSEKDDIQSAIDLFAMQDVRFAVLSERISMSLVSRTYERIRGGVGTALSGDSLKSRVFRGGAWLGMGSATEQLLRFGRNMLLTRLLAPEAFGTMAIILSISSVLQCLTDVGAKEALIQNPRGSEDGHAGAAWWLAMGRSCGFYAFLFCSAPFISHFYANGEITALLRVAAIGVVFEGAISSKAYVAMKEMKFSKWAAINHGGGIAGVVITVILSYFIRDVWALVLGFAAENAARCVLSYIICPYCPPLKWNGEAIRDLLKFSRGLFGLSILNLIFARTDIFVLGKLYSPTDLGLYAMAIYLAQTPASFVMNLINQTFMPAFSHVQDDNPRMNRILLRVTSLTALLGMPVLCFLFFCGHSLLTVVYGSRYGAVSQALVVASFVAFLNIANMQITLVFYAKGLPQLHRRSVALMAILMIILIYPFAKRFGLVGGQLACLISIAVGYLFQVERIRKITGVQLASYLKVCLTPALISLTVIAICIATRSLAAAAAHPLPNLLFGIVGCLVAYGLMGAMFLRERGVA